MNATNIEAYALAKGLDFTWKTATQAEKAEVAMQMFFENTEQYAGNFAKESTQTVTGSIGLLQAALGSFAAGLGNTNADMQNLTGNLVDAFQAVVENVVPIIQNLTAALPDALGAMLPAIGMLLPDLMETVTTLFKQVLDTLLGLLPSLIPVAVDAVLTIVDTLVDNLPMLIDGAFELITALAEGLIEALPELVPKIVEVMLKIVNTVIANLPLIAGAALQIIVALAGGLISSIPTLLASIPQLIAAYASAFDQYVSIIKDIGKNIVEGVWEGIKSMGAWLSKKASEFVDGFVDDVKGFLGIHSPSTVFRDEVGKNIVLGINEGIENNEKTVIKTAGEMSKHILSEAAKWVDDKKFYNQLSLKNELDFWKDLKAMEGLQGEQLKEINKKIYTAKTTLQEEENAAVKTLLDEQKKAFDEYQKSVDSRTASLEGFAGLFEKIESNSEITGQDLLENLRSQVDSFKAWQTDLEKLETKGISESLLSELRELGPKSADEIHALTGMSDRALQEYVRLFEEKGRLAKEQAQKEIGGFNFGDIGESGLGDTAELQGLKATATVVVDTLKTGISEDMVKIVDIAKETALSYIGAIAEMLGEFKTVGAMITDGLWVGIESGKSGLIENIKQMLRDVVSAAKEEMDIDSPSRVWAEIGGFMSQGLGAGFVGEMRNVSKQINDSIPSSVEMSGRYAANGAYGITTINDGGINLYIGTLNNSNDRDIQDVARVLEFQRQQKNLARGVVTV